MLSHLLISLLISLAIGIGIGNIFTLATFPSPPTQSGGGQVDSCKLESEGLHWWGESGGVKSFYTPPFFGSYQSFYNHPSSSPPIIPL
jgi:hypothetical protein